MPRNYKDEYEKFQSSPSSIKKRSKLNKINRDKGTYGNGDGKDVSHMSDGSIILEKASKNRGNKTRTAGDRKARGGFSAQEGVILNKETGEDWEDRKGWDRKYFPEKESPWKDPKKVISGLWNWRERLAENLNPVSYVNPIGRLEDAIIEDYQNEQRDPANSSLIPNVNLDERVDLLHMVLGLPQKKGTIEESIYRPTKVTEGDEDTVYYRSKAEEEDIVKALTGEDLGPSVNKYLSQNSSFDRWLKVKRSEHLGEISKEEATRRMGGLTSPLYGKTLGNYTLDYSVDEDGREYVSYYDKWNINPTEGKIGDDWIDTALSLSLIHISEPTRPY